MDIIVTFHHKDLLNIHRELSAVFFYEGFVSLIRGWELHRIISGYHNIQVRISKDVALNRKPGTCYDGLDYTEQEYIKLQNIIQESHEKYLVIQWKYSHTRG